MTSLANVNVGVNSVEILLKASGIIGPDGKIKSNLSLHDGEVRLNLPANLFPFLVPGEPAFVVVTVFQVRPSDPPAIEAPALILPK